ncbi:XI-D, partial [Symbiodinium pilosum]
MAGAADGQVTSVEKQVLESNPLLEAFGNARTLRNDNSSRFGKFIELQFRSSTSEALQAEDWMSNLKEGSSENAMMSTEGGAVVKDTFLDSCFVTPVVNADASSLGVAGENCRLCGARIQTYLLEKVRVCDQQEGERNYHLFYEAQWCPSRSQNLKLLFPQKLSKEKVKEEVTLNLEGFADLGNFAYLTRSSCKTLKDVDDIEMFERRIHAMQTIGIPNDEMTQILRMVASVLHLGNIKFDAPPNNSEGSMAMAECDRSVEMASKLLGVDRKSLESALCSQTRVTRSEKIRSPVNVRQAADNRDALAKAVYGIVFNFIVQSTNMSIGYVEDVKLFAGVLDIFGFECFKMNSFEQLCINFTNERLQQFFNSFVFKLEANP